MANSQRKAIIQQLITNLFPTITTGNGYNFTLVTKERGLRSMYNMNDAEFPALFIASADELRENVTHKDFMSILSAFIVGYVKKNQSLLTVQDQLDDLIEDVTKALYTDPTQNNTVSWTEVKSVDTDEGDDAEHAAFVMRVDFRYKNPGVTP